MYLQKRNRVTDVENKLIVSKRERGRERDKLGGWTGIYTQHYIHYI